MLLGRGAALKGASLVAGTPAATYTEVAIGGHTLVGGSIISGITGTAGVGTVNSNESTSTNLAVLTDGTVRSTAHADLWSTNTGYQGDVAIDYNFSAKTLKELWLYSLWGDNGRVNINCIVYYKSLTQTTWTSLITLSSGNSSGGSWSAKVYADNGILIVNATDIRFYFASASQQNGYVGYAEFEILAYP